MTTRTLTRVVFEYDDGAAEELVGADAAAWSKAANACITMSTVHGLPMDGTLIGKLRPVKPPFATERTCGTCARDLRCTGSTRHACLSSGRIHFTPRAKEASDGR